MGIDRTLEMVKELGLLAVVRGESREAAVEVSDALIEGFRPGVTELPERAGADLAGMGESGVEVLRTNLSWLRIETERLTRGVRVLRRRPGRM